MSYTVIGTPVRFIRAEVCSAATLPADPEVTLFAPFYPAKWEHDACAPSSRRFRITYDNGITEERAWYDVVTCDDDDRAVWCKLKFAFDVAVARRKVWEAEFELRKLIH